MDQVLKERDYDTILPIPVPGLLIGIGVLVEHGAIVELDFLWRDWNTRPARSKLAEQVRDALRDYFHRPTAVFSLPMKLTGTPFQQKVWQEMSRIPVGQTRTYGDLAQRLRSSPRAIGNACRANPLPIIVPCHRVVAANGEMGGFAGQRDGPQLVLKRWLLDHECCG